MPKPTAQIFIQSNGGAIQYGELLNAELDEVTWELNDAGSAKFTMLQNDPQILTPSPGTTEAKIVLTDGTNFRRFVGPIQTVNNSTAKAQFSVEGLEAWFKERIIDDATMEYTSIDQAVIATNLVNFAQSESTQANRDVNIDVGVFSVGTHLRSRRYERNNHQVIFDLLSEFPDLDDGFDWAVIPLANGLREFMTYYPTRGTLNTELVFEWDENGTRNLKDFKVDESALNLATHAYVSGGTNGTVKFEQNFENVSNSSTYEVRQRVFSEGSQKDVDWLLDKAKKNVAQYGTVQIVPQLQAIEAPSSILFALNVGDSAKIRIKNGRVNLNQNYRFVEIKYVPKTEVIELKVNEL